MNREGPEAERGGGIRERYRKRLTDTTTDPG